MPHSYTNPPELALLRSVALPGARRGLRTSDAERERAAETLRRHHAEGRLTTDELEERTERAYASTTVGDLEQLFSDLPRLPEGRGESERRRRRPTAWPPGLAVAIVVTLVAIAAVTSAHVLWLAWPLVFFVVFRFLRRGHWGRPPAWPDPWRRW
jgi:hypothetical protein